MSDVRVTLELRRLDTGEAEQDVYFKVDGGRFDSDKTLKLTENTKYRLKAVCKPAVVISNLLVLGQKVSFEEVSRDESSSTYQSVWTTTGLAPTKKNQRSLCPLVIEVSGEGEICINLQSKVYPVSESKHSTWGTPLHHILCVCNRQEGHMAYSVKEMTFR